MVGGANVRSHQQVKVMEDGEAGASLVPDFINAERHFLIQESLIAGYKTQRIGIGLDVGIGITIFREERYTSKNLSMDILLADL